MYDFGAKTMVNGMQITWENAQPRSTRSSFRRWETWYQARYVVGSTGGTQQFMNLNTNARYIRISVASSVRRNTDIHFSRRVRQSRVAITTLKAAPRRQLRLSRSRQMAATCGAAPWDGSSGSLHSRCRTGPW